MRLRQAPPLQRIPLQRLRPRHRPRWCRSNLLIMALEMIQLRRPLLKRWERRQGLLFPHASPDAFRDLQWLLKPTVDRMDDMYTSFGDCPEGAKSGPGRVGDIFEICFVLMMYGSHWKALFQLLECLGHPTLMEVHLNKEKPPSMSPSEACMFASQDSVSRCYRC